MDDPAEKSREDRSGADRHDGPDRDAGLLDTSEERELIAADRGRAEEDGARRASCGHAWRTPAGDEDEQEPAHEDTRCTDGRGRRVRPKRLRRPRGAEAQGREEDKNTCRSHEIEELFHNRP